MDRRPSPLASMALVPGQYSALLASIMLVAPSHWRDTHWRWPYNVLFTMATLRIHGTWTWGPVRMPTSELSTMLLRTMASETTWMASPQFHITLASTMLSPGPPP